MRKIPQLTHYTFATRFLSFAKSVEPQCQAGMEEKEYMVWAAEQMLKSQFESATDQDEIDYLERCNPELLTSQTSTDGK